MLNDSQKAKVSHFLNDKAMSETVLWVIQQSFLKARSNKEVHYLAAKSLAVEFLEEAKKDLDKYNQNEAQQGRERGQIAL